MSKLYLDLRALSAVPDPYLATTEDIMSYSGINVGNFAFRHALKSLININEYKVVDYPAFNQAVAKEQPKSVVISCANWLCALNSMKSQMLFGRIWKVIRPEKLSAVCLSHNQRSIFADMIFTLQPKLKPFLRIVMVKGGANPIQPLNYKSVF
jgi:hypothetical protein